MKKLITVGVLAAIAVLGAGSANAAAVPSKVLNCAPGSYIEMRNTGLQFAGNPELVAFTPFQATKPKTGSLCGVIAYKYKPKVTSKSYVVIAPTAKRGTGINVGVVSQNNLIANYRLNVK